MPRKGHATAKQQQNVVPYNYKPGQSGNPRGRPVGSRNKLQEDFFRDLCDSWAVFGKAALTTLAWTQPAEYTRIVSGLMPREMKATITNVHLERLSTNELEHIIAESRANSGDPAAPEEGATTLQ